MVPDASLLDRFRGDFDALIAPRARAGIAVSGGPDSLALLLLAAAAYSDCIEAATVDHRLRSESAEEAATVASTCARLCVPHEILSAGWAEKPRTAIQERARCERYRLLGGWARRRGLAAIVTAHHADDQAETLLMRLNRGSGVRGLAAMRPVATIPGSELPLLRPLLGWRRSELEAICSAAGLSPAVDPSNIDPAYERVRIRGALGETPWLDPRSLASSAAHLGDADVALDWAASREWEKGVTNGADAIAYRPGDAPSEIRRRIVSSAVSRLASEGEGAELRGRELDRLLAILVDGRRATIRGVLCAGGSEWRFTRAPARSS